MSDPGVVRGPIVIPNCIQLLLQYNLANTKTVYNVFHAIVGGGFVANAATAEAIRASLAGSAAWTAWKAYMSTACSWSNIWLRDLRVAGQPLVSGTNTAQAGTDATGALPPGDSICITLRTALAGRSGRGRTYLAGLGKAAVDANGAIVAAANTAAVNFVTQIDTSSTASGAPLALALPARLDYTSDKGTHHPARVATAIDITSFSARNTILDHQRRRAGRS